MKKINVEKELKQWLIEYLTNAVHDCSAENSEDFNKWAQSYKKEDAEVLVNMEFVADWGYEKREEIDESEAVEYADSLLQIILENWYI